MLPPMPGTSVAAPPQSARLHLRGAPLDAAPQARPPPWRNGAERIGPSTGGHRAAAQRTRGHPAPQEKPAVAPAPPELGLRPPPSPPRAPRTHGTAGGRQAGRRGGRKRRRKLGRSQGRAAPLRPARPAPGLAALLPAPARTAPAGPGRAAPGAVRPGKERAAGDRGSGAGSWAKLSSPVGRAVGKRGCPWLPAGRERAWTRREATGSGRSGCGAA